MRRQPLLKRRVCSASCSVAELGEGEKRLVSLEIGPQFTAKVYEEADYSFHIVFTSEDFASLAEARNFIEAVTRGLQNGKVR